MKDKINFSYRNSDRPPKWLINLADTILYAIAFLLLAVIIFPLFKEFINLL